MSQQELVIRVVETLDELAVPYLITGSWASSLQGEPRASHDVDLVVALEPGAVPGLVAAFPADEFFLSRAAIEDAVRERSMFNLLDHREGDKVDFWLLTDEPWDQSRMARRQEGTVGGRQVFFSTPEDTILAKLRWAELSGGSEKQFTDALRVYEVQRECLDTQYIDAWAARLGVAEMWKQLREAAEK